MIELELISTDWLFEDCKVSGFEALEPCKFISRIVLNLRPIRPDKVYGCAAQRRMKEESR